MFSFLPPFKEMGTKNTLEALTEAFQIFHGIVHTPDYRSRGEERKLHTHCIFHYTVKGQGQFLYKGKTYTVNEGQGFFNIINEPLCGYGYPEEATEPWEFTVVCFRGGNIRELTKQLNEKQLIYNISPQAFSLLCRNLFYEQQGAKLTFLPSLISLITQNDGPQTKLSLAFKEIVLRDIMLNPTISAIAEEIGVSREHLQRQFALENGISPAKYLTTKRFETLCLLLASNIPEKDVSQKMHFSSQGALSAFFKKHSNVTPTQYRKNNYLLP